MKNRRDTTTRDRLATIGEPDFMESLVQAAGEPPKARSAGFRVDTHVFRELGELLVGRDSTALNELIKNAYDADATAVVVHGEHLGDPERGRFIITDDGHGMTLDTLERGFLTIAGRLKDQGSKQSPVHGRRMTGAKGVGRLAAQKLARQVLVDTTPDRATLGSTAQGGSLTIDWEAIERLELVEHVSTSGAVRIEPVADTGSAHGTRIELAKLRRAWTDSQRALLVSELLSFRPPASVIDIPVEILSRKSLLGRIRIADTASGEPNFDIQYSGALEVGDAWYSQLLEGTLWVLEVDAMTGTVRYQVTPTTTGEAKHGANARNWSGEMDHPSAGGPFFTARIFIREGAPRGGDLAAEWIRTQGGVRVYVEGFRVLPYGEPGDDWLRIDRDYSRRQKGDLPYLEEFRPKLRSKMKLDLVRRAPLSMLPGRNYFGSVFLTEENLGGLRMVVNREGFVADDAWRVVQDVVRVGVDLSIRHRAAVAPKKVRQQASVTGTTAASVTTDNATPSGTDVSETNAAQSTPSPDDNADTEMTPAPQLVAAMRMALANNDYPSALNALQSLENSLRHAPDLTDESAPTDEFAPIDQDDELQHLSWVLESIGLQLHEFIHEINSALSMVNALLDYMQGLRAQVVAMTHKLNPTLNRFEEILTDLRQHLERQASVLTNVTGPDPRRRRAPQGYHRRFAVAQALLEQVANRRRIHVMNDIPDALRSPPMFGAELTMLFSNLLSNAIKNAGFDGRVVVRAMADDSYSTIVIENTGVRVDLADAERWFRPFESTTVRPDPVLGQGMGLGLPISRRIVESCRGDIRFVEPTAGFSTAIAIRLPRR